MRLFGRNNKAISPVIGTIVIIMIVLSVTATVMLWGLPYLSNLRAKSQQESVAAQLGIIDDSLSNIINNIGTSREHTVNTVSGQPFCEI